MSPSLDELLEQIRKGELRVPERLRPSLEAIVRQGGPPEDLDAWAEKLAEDLTNPDLDRTEEPA